MKLDANGLLRVSVRASAHANTESFPLRFGFTFGLDHYLDLKITRDCGRDRKYQDRFHVDAAFSSPMGDELLGHFVLMEAVGGLPEVVTAWGHDADTEFYLSETIKRLRRSGFLTTQDLLSMYPMYRSGELRSSADLVAYLSKSIAAADRNRLGAEAAQAREEARQLIAERNLLSKELGEAKEQNERLRRELAAARDQGSTVSFSAPDLLLKVNEGVPYRGSSCTELVFGDGSKRYMKVATFDPSGAITSRAHSLVGQRVKISCWDPIDRPGYWTRRGYFRNLYVVDATAERLVALHP